MGELQDFHKCRAATLMAKLIFWRERSPDSHSWLLRLASRLLIKSWVKKKQEFIRTVYTEGNSSNFVFEILFLNSDLSWNKKLTDHIL